ncbi:MAG: beta-ketoacyl-[acyl-carrier-protein] synthase family protein [Verrucomicrobiales bacterium]
MAFLSGRVHSGEHRRVVITGAGILTSMGCGWAANAEGFRAGRSALRDITLFDTSRHRTGRAGELTLPAALPSNLLGKRQAGRVDRPSAMLIHAGGEALGQAGWKVGAEGQVPICLGTSAGAMEIGEAYYRQSVDEPTRRRGQATRVWQYQTQTQARHLADAFGLSGPVSIITNACSSGANAIGHGFHLVKRGQADRVLCGGYDALSAMVFAGFDSLQALTTGVPRPFDADRDGLALGEGAALVTLETLQAAEKRGAEILGEVVGYGASTDSHHLTQPHPQGDAALRSMQAACDEAGIGPEQVDYINSHGTGTPLNDIAEGRAIQRWAGAGVGRVAVSSTKASIGHLLGGAGAVEAVIALMAMRGNWLPPTTTVREPDDVCTFDLIREPRDAQVDCVLTNSFGFGGANATLVMREVGS